MGVSIPDNPGEQHVAGIRHSATTNSLGALLGNPHVVARRTVSGRHTLTATLGPLPAMVSAEPRLSDPSASRGNSGAGADNVRPDPATSNGLLVGSDPVGCRKTSSGPPGTRFLTAELAGEDERCVPYRNRGPA